MGVFLKIVLPLAAGAGTAVLVWRLTRGEEPTTPSVEGTLRGYTQASSLVNPSLYRPLASAGLQQLTFGR